MPNRSLTLAFRVDASSKIGFGHVMRCLALAEALKAAGARILFVCRQLPGFANAVIANQGHECLTLPLERVHDEPVQGRWLPTLEMRDLRASISLLASVGIGPEQPLDWCVVDHYKIGSLWHGAMRTIARRIMVIDDLANRDLNCDLLLDQNLHEDAEVRYAACFAAPGSPQLLLGPHFALLGREFAQWRASVAVRKSPPRHILIAFGGGDVHNVTSLAIETLRSASADKLDLTVAIGAGHPARDTLEHAASAGRIRLYIDSRAIAELMTCADLAIGASGVMTWERACLGLPSVVVALAQNQEAIAETLAKMGLITYLGVVDNSLPARLRQVVAAALHGRLDLDRQSREVMALVDGQGARRVAARLRAATLGD